MPHPAYEALRYLYLVTLLAACGYAAWRGGVAERWGAGIQFTTSFASLPAVIIAGAAGWETGQGALLLVDLIALAAFMTLALRSTAFWPLWVAGFHLDAVLTHFAKLIAPDTLPKGYALLQGFWAYPLMAALVVGAWHHARAGRDEAGSARPQRGVDTP